MCCRNSPHLSLSSLWERITSAIWASFSLAEKLGVYLSLGSFQLYMSVHKAQMSAFPFSKDLNLTSSFGAKMINLFNIIYAMNIY